MEGLGISDEGWVLLSTTGMLYLHALARVFPSSDVCVCLSINLESMTAPQLRSRLETSRTSLASRDHADSVSKSPGSVHSDDMLSRKASQLRVYISSARHDLEMRRSRDSRSKQRPAVLSP